jgi:hypothetical protein
MVKVIREFTEEEKQIMKDGFVDVEKTTHELLMEGFNEEQRQREEEDEE